MDTDTSILRKWRILNPRNADIFGVRSSPILIGANFKSNGVPAVEINIRDHFKLNQVNLTVTI